MIALRSLAMSNVEISHEQFEVDKETFEQIDKIVHDVKSKYTNWREFIDEAVRIYATWWTNPPDAFTIFTDELWPHMMKEQHDVMKNPKLGQVGIYEDMKKMSEERHAHVDEKTGECLTCKAKHTLKKDGTYDLPSKPVDIKIQNDAKRELESKEWVNYTIKEVRLKQILRTVKQAESGGSRRFLSPNDFMVTTLDLFITWWDNPAAATEMMYELFPFLTKKQCKHWYDLDGTGKGYMGFKKLAEKYHKDVLGITMIMDDGIEQLIEKNKIDEQYRQSNLRYEKEQEEDPLTDSQRRQWERENEIDMEELDKTRRHYAIRSFNKELLERNKEDITRYMAEKPSRFEKPKGAIPSEDNPSIWAFYSRFFPTKLALTVLADMITKNGGDPVSYLDFRNETYEKAIVVSEHLKNFEHKWVNEKDGKMGLPRNKKISTGLPLPIDEDEQDRKKIIKSEASKERFLEYFVGISIKQWNRKKHDQKKFNGALNSMGLVHITNSEDRLKITLSNNGAEFYNIDNDILYNFQENVSNMTTLKPVNDAESKFIMNKIITKFSQEKTFADCIKKELVKADDYVFGKELDEACFKGDKGQRQATMGRLAEMDLVDWRISSKKENPDDPTNWGKSCFKLNEPLKNKW